MSRTGLGEGVMAKKAKDNKQISFVFSNNAGIIDSTQTKGGRENVVVRFIDPTSKRVRETAQDRVQKDGVFRISRNNSRRKS